MPGGYSLSAHAPTGGRGGPASCRQPPSSPGGKADLTGVGVGDEAARRLDPAEKDRGEHRARIRLAQLAVDRGENVARYYPCRIVAQRDRAQARPSPGQENRRCGTLARNIADREPDHAIAVGEEVAQIAADVARRLEHQVDGKSPGRIGEVRRDHAELQLAGCQQLVFRLFQSRAQRIAQMLLFERGTDPRPQQRRVDRLGEVVLGAKLDTAHHARHFVRCRDHNDGQRFKPALIAQCFQDLYAADVRHHQVQQDEVKLPLCDQRQRFASIGGGDYIVNAKERQPIGEHLPIVFYVVNDQYRCGGEGQGRRTTCGRHAHL